MSYQVLSRSTGRREVRRVDLPIVGWEPEPPPPPVAGVVYVGDSSYLIYKFTADGTFLHTIGDGHFDGDVGGLACDSSGNIYGADSYDHRVLKFSPNGELLLAIGEPGSGPGEFDWPFDMATDRADNLYVLDLQNKRVQKFDSDGNYLLQWTRAGFSSGSKNTMTGICSDKEDNVYVLCYRHAASFARVYKFNSSGVFISEFGSFGTGNGQIRYPSPCGIASDAAGDIYILDAYGYNGRVQKFSSNGTFLSVFLSEETFEDEWGDPYSWGGNAIACDAEGNVYINEAHEGDTMKFSPSGELLGQFKKHSLYLHHGLACFPRPF